MTRFIAAFFCLLGLAGCAPQQEEAPSWRTFSHPNFALTFSYDPSYVPEDMVQEEISFDDHMIPADTISLRKGMAESAFIQVLQATDPLIIQSLSSDDSSAQQVGIRGEAVTKIITPGMGSPESYVFQKNGNYIVLIFVFPPSQAEMDRTLHSVVLR